MDSNAHSWNRTCYNSIQELHCLPVCFCIQFKLLVLTFRTFHGVGPGYLRNQATFPHLPHQISQRRHAVDTTDQGSTFGESKGDVPSLPWCLPYGTSPPPQIRLATSHLTFQDLFMRLGLGLLWNLTLGKIDPLLRGGISYSPSTCIVF